MHPTISSLPSTLFYQNRLKDGPDMELKTAQPWHSHEMFGTYRFFNVASGLEESTNGQSLKNRGESQVAVALYARLTQEFKGTDLNYRVGVISGYRGQVVELKTAFKNRFGNDILDKVHFHTVDGFQGQEKDVIILSCVRSGPGVTGIGFLRGMSNPGTRCQLS